MSTPSPSRIIICSAENMWWRLNWVICISNIHPGPSGSQWHICQNGYGLVVDLVIENKPCRPHLCSCLSSGISELRPPMGPFLTGLNHVNCEVVLFLRLPYIGNTVFVPLGSGGGLNSKELANCPGFHCMQQSWGYLYKILTGCNSKNKCGL